MKIKSFFENFIILAIILVIIQTFLDEIAVVLRWSLNFRHYLIYAGLIFDLIFTIEFFVRLIIASKKSKAHIYFFYERGWVDFIASIPLLILNSGPSAYLLYTGAMTGNVEGLGVLNILKVVKAIRITRVLRLIRILKIFGKIKNAESKMAQRHITTISTLICTSILVVIIVFGAFGFPGINKLEEERIDIYKNQINTYIKLSKKYGELSLYSQMKIGFESDSNVLNFKVNGQEYNQYAPYVRKKMFNYDETESFNIGQIKMMISVQDIRQKESKINILFFSIIVFVIISIMVIYSKHFVQTVSDVVHVMRRGLEEEDYFLEAKIKEHYKEDEIFKLAEDYNSTWLTVKLKYKEKIYDTVEQDDLSVDDFFG